MLSLTSMLIVFIFLVLFNIKITLSSFLREKFTLTLYHKILSLKLTYFMKPVPGELSWLQTVSHALNIQSFIFRLNLF